MGRAWPTVTNIGKQCVIDSLPQRSIIVGNRDYYATPIAYINPTHHLLYRTFPHISYSDNTQVHPLLDSSVYTNSLPRTPSRPLIMPRIRFPKAQRFAVAKMDPVAMVVNLGLDAQAVAEAEAMMPKKYLVYLDVVRCDGHSTPTHI